LPVKIPVTFSHCVDEKFGKGKERKRRVLGFEEEIVLRLRLNLGEHKMRSMSPLHSGERLVHLERAASLRVGGGLMKSEQKGTAGTG
jgi:hypothetical protein